MPVIKVRIAKSLSNVLVSGHDIKRYIWPKKSLKQFSGPKKIRLNCKSKKKFKRSKPIRLASIKSKTGLISWDKETYKGILHVQTSEKFNGCDIINELYLEDYLATLLPKEMNTKWPIEALKAQAVAARSYAYFKVKTNQVSKSKGFKTNYHIENSEKHQVNGSFFDATKKTIKASKETRGEILTLKGKKLTPIFFHSKCGGKTLLPSQVWRNKVAGYKSVPCPFCHKHGKKNWTHSIKKTKFVKSMSKVLKAYSSDKVNLRSSAIRLPNDKKNSSWLRFYNKSDFKAVKKSRIRSIMGRTLIPSNYYNVKEKGQNIQISGSGYGHGVGMCQFGAKELALQGYTYRQILAHYFPKLKLKKIY